MRRNLLAPSSLIRQLINALAPKKKWMNDERFEGLVKVGQCGNGAVVLCYD